MPIDERDKLFKKMHIFLTKEDLENFNLTLRKMQETALQEIQEVRLTVEEELQVKFKPKELIRLRELGLTDKQLLALTPNTNPFSDFALGERMTLQDMLDAQTLFYNRLQAEYMKWFTTQF